MTNPENTKMVENINYHDKIVFFLIKKDIQNVFLECLQQDNYFFKSREVEESELKTMIRRKKPMQNYPSYQMTVSNLINYFEKDKKSLILGEFILREKCFYLFYDTKEEVVVSQYDTPFITIDKVLSLNEEYLSKGLDLIRFEKKNALILPL